MSLITRTYTFTDGTTAYGSQVESEIGNIATVLNAVDAGATGITTLKVTSSLLNAAGTASLPAYSFTADPNSGIYNTAADQIGLVLNGANSVQFLTTDIFLYIGGSPKLDLTATTFNPTGAGVISTGDGSNYWNDISYKTLTDRGCLPWCDTGVEMRDGTIVSDLDALCSIQKHPTRKTPAGLPRLDYETLPKHAYRKVEDEFPGVKVERDINGEAWITRINRETKKEERVQVQDGAEMTMIFGIFIGAFKEMRSRMEALENKKQENLNG